MYIDITTYRDEGEETIIEVVTYTHIKNLTFAPDVDVTGNSLPIPGFEADIITTDDLHNAYVATLYDDLDQDWATYDLTYAERVDENTVHIKAQNALYNLEYVELEEQMYQGEAASDVIAELFRNVTNEYTLDESLSNIPISGFCPVQTARERLAWLCFVLGAYVDATFTGVAEIKPVDDTERLIPLEKTFWRPAVTFDDWVTSVQVTAYSITRAASEEEWRDNDSSYMLPLPWIATEQVMALVNPMAPAGARENIKVIEGVYLVNQSNISGILSRLAKYWFKRETVSLDCINNRDYKPGELVTFYTGEESLMRGYVQSAAWRFGVQARSTLKLVGCDSKPGAKLTINHLYNGTRIGRQVVYLPVSYVFNIENPYIDRTSGGRRRVYRPLTANATGTMQAGGNTVNVNYEIALDLYKNVLTILSVDDVSLDGSIGVIE